MIPRTQGPFDDTYASLMEAFHAALADTLRRDDAGDTPLAPELRTQVVEAIDCIRRLRQHWPRPDDTKQWTDPTEDETSKTLGRFHIKRELGRGSFGTVYLAYDPELAREVALKVPRFDVLAAPESRDRFRREARAAAGLDHPNIVQVFEAGDVGPVCYIAAAYCPGVTLANWLKEQNDPVPYHLAAEIAAALADAVQHAHSRGVLHRDLKPANVLLQTTEDTQKTGTMPPGASFGISWRFTPKITDFGLAKIQSPDSTGGTHSGVILGTPQYMAPEQAGGSKEQVREPADLYALGVILYEILTGRPPFQADSVFDLLVQQLSVEPVSLRRLRPGVPVDLETICLKCLQKEPEKRYASADHLATDLRRFLKGEPIQARPVGTRERLHKWVRRKPALAALSAGLIIVIIGSLVGLTALYIHAAGQRTLAEKEKSDAIDARKRMEQSEGTTRAINHFFLNDVIGAAQPKGVGLGRDVSLRQALDVAAPKIEKGFEGQPEAEAGVCDALGRAYVALGAYDKALPLLQKAVGVRAQFLGPHDGNTLISRLALADVVYYQGKYDEAETILRDCLKAAQMVYGPDHQTTLEAQGRLANVLRLLRRHEEAEKLFRDALEVCQAKFGPDHTMTLQRQKDMAEMACSLGRFDEAETLFRSIWESLLRTNGPENFQTLVVQSRLAETIVELKRFDEAESLLRQTLDGRRRVMGEGDPATYSLQGGLAQTLQEQGKLDEAASHFEHALNGYRKSLPAGHVLIGFMQSQYGDCLTDLGRYAEAEPLLLQGFQLMDTSKVRSPRRSREGAERLAKLYRNWGKSEQAQEWETKAATLKSDVQRPTPIKKE